VTLAEKESHLLNRLTSYIEQRCTKYHNGIQDTMFSFPKRQVLPLILALLTIFPLRALGFSLEVTSAEFSSWDERCQAFYMGAPVGRFSEHRHKVPQETQNYWLRQGKIRQAGPWHYCGGLIHYQRARAIFGNEVHKRRELTKAKNGARYTYERLDPGIEFWAEITTFMARMCFELGEINEAIRYFDAAIRAHPNYAPAYIGKSIVIWKAGRSVEAIATLKGAIEQHDIKSPELFYNLGLFYYKQGNMEQATQYASMAYEKSYPLNGLRRLLADKGITLNTSQ